MLQWLCVGWILGLTTMGNTNSSSQISSFVVLSSVLIWLMLYRSYFARFRHIAIRCLMLAFTIGFGFFLGQGYAYQSLEHRLQNVEQQRELQDIVVYIEKINQISPNSIQQPLQVLNQYGHSVQWMGSLKVEDDPASRVEQPQLELGRYYQLSGEVRPAHAYATPGAFDVEKWYIEQNIMAGFRIKHIQVLTEQQVYGLGYTKQLREHQQLSQKFKVWIESKRLSLREFIQKQPIQHKGLMLALLTGDESLLSKETETQFQRFGMSHLLAISGPHVVIFALIFCACLQYFTSRWLPNFYLKCPKQYYLSVPFLLCVLLYCAFVGFEIPALRTLLICSIATLSLWLKQSIQPLKLLIFSAAILLWLDPFSILSAAFWLSYGACFVLLRIYQTLSQQDWHHSATQLEKTKQEKAIFALKVLVESQWKIFLALFPLMIIFFKQVAWISPLSNLFAIPLIGLVIVPFDIVAALLFFISEPLASLIFQINDLWLGLLLGLIHILDVIFSPQLIPIAMTAWMLCLCVLVLGILFAPQGLIPKAWAVCAVIPIFVAPFHEHPFELSVLDVGQGQAVFIRQGRHSMMLDMGGNYDESKFSVGQQIIRPFLSVKGVSRLDQLMFSHLDQDHSGAFDSIQTQLKVGELISNEMIENENNLPTRLCQQGQTWSWQGQVNFTVLSPQAEQLNSAKFNKNESSCVLYVQVKDAWPYQHFLLMGDAGWETEFQILQHYPHLKVDVLVLGHHGSQHSSAYYFLKHYQPKLAIASAGHANRYGHPSNITQARLDELNIPLRSTIEQGTIRFYLEGHEMKLASHREQTKWLRR